MIYRKICEVDILLITRYSVGFFVIYVTFLLVISWHFQMVLLSLHYS